MNVKQKSFDRFVFVSLCCRKRLCVGRFVIVFMLQKKVVCWQVCNCFFMLQKKVVCWQVCNCGFVLQKMVVCWQVCNCGFVLQGKGCVLVFFIYLAIKQTVLLYLVTLLGIFTSFWFQNSVPVLKQYFICQYKNSITFFDFWCFNTSFSNISAISWRPVLVVEEAGENHRPRASNW